MKNMGLKLTKEARKKIEKEMKKAQRLYANSKVKGSIT